MKLVKLTNLDDETVYLNPEQLITIEKEVDEKLFSKTEYTALFLRDDNHLHVQESVEQVAKLIEEAKS